MVIQIEGLDYYISIVPTYTKIRYGDPGLVYGAPGLVYGGLRLNDNVVAGLSLDSSLTISQKLEPEQGRGAVSTMTLVFVDFNQMFTKLISPGQDLNDLLGNKLVKVYLGYQTQSFPEDYYVVFRGYASSTRAQSGKITIQLSDANLKRRANIFSNQACKTTAAITDSQTNIPVDKNTDFSQLILGPNGTYDTSIETLIRINDEIMNYNAAGFSPPNLFTVTRGTHGSVAVAADTDSDVNQLFMLQGNIFDMALKVMLSGWNGPFVTDLTPLGIQNAQDYGIESNILRMPDSYDTIEELNVRPGDYMYVTGSPSGNDGTYILESIESSDGQNNNILRFTTPFVAAEYPITTTRLAFRSQYDTYPAACGVKMRPTEIDMQAWEDLRDTFFNTTYSQMRFFMSEKQSGKEFIEKELLLPVGAYSITRFGRLSVKITLPPIAGQKIIVLDNTNIIDPAGIVVERALNTRRYFNEIDYQFDLDPISGKYLNVVNTLDTDSLNTIGLLSIMPIKSQGLRTSYAAATLIDKRGLNLLTRYKNAAFEVQNVKVNWGAGSLIEAGDTPILKDNGLLQIANLNTGERNLGTALFEVIDRAIDIKTGVVTLKLLSNVGYQASDRFAVISPTSQIAATGSTTQEIKIEDSYGIAYPGNEREKWSAIIGSNIRIHTKDETQSYVRTLLAFSSSDRYKIIVDPALPVVPDDSWVIDIDDYPNTVNAFDNQALKLLYCYIDPTINVIGGLSNTQFQVNLSDASAFTVGLPVSVHNPDFSNDSVETTVKSITVNVIEVANDLGFTPAAGDSAELIGFIDAGGPYRIL
jgi:hypothetical protein